MMTGRKNQSSETIEQAKVIPYNSFMAARQRAIADKKGKRGITIAHGRVVGI